MFWVGRSGLLTTFFLKIPKFVWNGQPFFNIEPDPEVLNIVNNLAADTRTRSWSNDVAENYLNKQTGE